MSVILETFAQRFRRLRLEQGLSIVEMARLCGASEGTIRALEKGTIKNPALVLGLRLAEVLQVDPYRLALGEAGELVGRVNELEQRLTALEQRCGLGLAADPSSDGNNARSMSPR